MTPTHRNDSRSPSISIGIFAWNEERGVARTLRSLFQQSIFGKLRPRGEVCEVICVCNGCTDNTARLVSQFFAAQKGFHPFPESFTTRVVDLKERGKFNAWNQFVHRFASPNARVFILMDADVSIHRCDTLWNMLHLLETEPEANVAVDRPRKNLEFKPRKSWKDRVSLAAARLTSAAQAQLCAQLYAIRADTARNIYLPKDLAACEDGFIKALVCTDFLAHPVWPRRLRRAEGAEHTFEAYTSPWAILRNQKRQIIGQTMVHILVDNYLKSLPPEQQHDLANTLRTRDSTDPEWLKRLLALHLQQSRFFWRLHPGLLGQRFKHLAHLGFGRRATFLPVAIAGSCFSLLAGLLAWRSLKAGCTDYWPPAPRSGGDPALPTAMAEPKLVAKTS